MADKEMFQNNYTVIIQRISGGKTGGRYSLSGYENKLRFEITSSSDFRGDPNNNNNNNNSNNNNRGIGTCAKGIRNLACFELLEDGIHAIKVTPTWDKYFNVEYTKSNGHSSSAPQDSTSVQVIHKRNGLSGNDSVQDNNNVALVYVPVEKNLMKESPIKMSTFGGGGGIDKKQDMVQSRIASATSMSDVAISEGDLQSYDRFTFKFVGVDLSRNSEGFCGEDSSCEIGEPQNSEVNGNEEDTLHGESGMGASNENSSKIYESISDTEFQYLREDVGRIHFQAFFDNAISLTIEMQNLFLHKLRPIHGEPQFRVMNDFYLQNEASFNSTSHNSQKFRDLAEIARTQAIFQQREDVPHSESREMMMRSPWHKGSIRAQVIRKFVKTIVKHRLQSLGVQQLDCNEILDIWEAKQRNPFSFLFPEEEEATPTTQGRTGMISPSFLSTPNSDLFHLSPSGHITKSIFSTFVSQVESLKGILNNATCNLVHTSTTLLLPEIKLLWGRQLDTNRNRIFIQEWIRLILLAGIELQPISPEEVLLMINRELKTVKKLSTQLYKSSKKVFLKIETLWGLSEAVFRKTLGSLNPKSLKKLDAFDLAMKRKYSPDVIHFEPDELHRIDISLGDLFRDHLFFRETGKGELLIKNEIDSEWGTFMEMEFGERRATFLGMTEDLGTTLRSCLTTVQHLQEIYTAGYPGSIKKLLKEVVEELKFTAGREDLTILIRTSIVTHVSCLHEMLTRLMYIAKEVKGVAKQFKESIAGMGTLDVARVKREFKKRGREKKGCEGVEEGMTTFSGFFQYRNGGGGMGNAQLVTPFCGGGG